MKKLWIIEWTDSRPDGFLSGNIRHTIEYDVFLHPEGDAVEYVPASAYESLLNAAKPFIAAPCPWDEKCAVVGNSCECAALKDVVLGRPVIKKD